jgi:hypothetical protein
MYGCLSRRDSRPPLRAEFVAVLLFASLEFASVEAEMVVSVGLEL